MPLASIPSPSQGVWHLGLVPLRGLRPVHRARSHRRRLSSANAAGAPAAARPARSWTSPSGPCRSAWSAAASTTSSPTGSCTSGRRARTRSTPYDLGGRAGHLGRRRARRASAPGRLPQPRHLAAAVADTVAPGIAVAQAIGRWGNWFNQELFGGPPTCRGAWRSTPRTGRRRSPGVATYHPTFLYESLWDLGVGAARDLGRTAGSRCGTAGCSRSTSPATPWAGSGSRACASTPPTTSWACGSTSGPRSSCSSAATDLLLVRQEQDRRRARRHAAGARPGLAGAEGRRPGAPVRPGRRGRRSRHRRGGRGRRRVEAGEPERRGARGRGAAELRRADARTADPAHPADQADDRPPGEKAGAAQSVRDHRPGARRTTTTVAAEGRRHGGRRPEDVTAEAVPRERNSAMSRGAAPRSITQHRDVNGGWLRPRCSARWTGSSRTSP